ncbi:MAG TPA: DUF2141 domain-containing protein [Rhodocyclaceae bacterium]|nr:DUF2141 domain-containing protein [Rhodocyclaceae bacterium]
MLSRFTYMALVFGMASASASAADLTVVLENTIPNGGNVRAAIYGQSADFLKKSLRGAESPVNGNSVTLVFKDLPAGDYAVTAFQDSNGNKKLDTSIVGIPLEPYGMSNDARGGLDGAPKFSDAAFHLGDSDLTVRIQLK